MERMGGLVRVTKDLVAASATPMVLGILAEGDSYGYAILRRINELSGGELDWTEGLLYPLLHRLERLRHVKCGRHSGRGRRGPLRPAAAPARAARPREVGLAFGRGRAAAQVLPHHRRGPGRAGRAAP